VCAGSSGGVDYVPVVPEAVVTSAIRSPSPSSSHARLLSLCVASDPAHAATFAAFLQYVNHSLLCDFSFFIPLATYLLVELPFCWQDCRFLIIFSPPFYFISLVTPDRLLACRLSPLPLPCAPSSPSGATTPPSRLRLPRLMKLGCKLSCQLAFQPANLTWYCWDFFHAHESRAKMLLHWQRMRPVV
jgi:hypothetical protein